VRVIVNGKTIVADGQLTRSVRRVLQDRHRAVMRAAVLRAAGQPVTIEEVRVRDPGPGEVRVAIRAAGLCHST